MIAEAMDAADSVIRALAVWIVLAAAGATAVTFAVVVAVACAVLAVRRGVVAVLSLVQHSSGGEVVRIAPEAAQTPSRPAPSWARTDEEAA